VVSGFQPKAQPSPGAATGSGGGRVYLTVLVLDVPRDTQVAGTLYRVDANGRLTLERSISIPKTSGDYGGLTLFLDAGTYAVEAVLPSGQRISEVFELDDGQDLSIVLRFNLPSPHEWMRWETYAGLVDERRYHEAAGGGDLGGHPSFEVSWHDGERMLEWDLLDRAILNPVPIDFAGPPREGPWFDRANQDRLSQKVVVRSTGAPAVCVARAGTAVTLQPVVTGGQYQIVMYGAPADRSIRAWTTVIDNPIFASALAYQARGATDSAKAVLRERQLSIGPGTAFGTVFDCCAILYLYLHDRDRLWFDPRLWLEYQRQSSTLADVHILSAWYRLLGAMTAEDLQPVQDDLNHAYACGLPAFSQGVRLLRDGLAMFGSDLGGERSDVVRRVARRVDFTQPFTSLRLSSAASRLDDPSGGAA
jgi:hypothetical protein